jgi:hypothetical protein
MSKILTTLIYTGPALLGALMVYRAKKLSIAYNAWTTGVRERNPHINPPPTPEAREKNTLIMTWLFRLVGLFVALFSILLLLGNLAAN